MASSAARDCSSDQEVDPWYWLPGSITDRVQLSTMRFHIILCLQIIHTEKQINGHSSMWYLQKPSLRKTNWRWTFCFGACVILIMKEGRAYFFTAAYHWGVIEMLWPHFSGVLMSSIFIYCLRSSYNAFYTLAHVRSLMLENKKPFYELWVIQPVWSVQ